MNRVILKVRDRKQIKDLEKFGSIIFQSPILNRVILEVNQENICLLKKHENVISCEHEQIGKLMIV
ncbi:hypothetical protein D1606_12005 [Rummeliibacillus sp. POC4]|nr:hypothetical protein D1606_12005 [Rummeliibacillus sp. POC4]